MRTITPAVKTVLAALLIGVALFVLVFGLDGLLMLAYGHNRWLWEAFPPSRARIDPGYQAMLALVPLLVGAYCFVGVWAVHPGWRMALVGSTVALVGWVVLALAQTRAF